MRIIRPRCPNCSKVQNEWLDGEAGYTCPRCKLPFTISTKKEYISHKELRLERLSSPRLDN